MSDRVHEGMRCVQCHRVAKPAKLRFQGFPISGWACTCGERYYHPADAQRILSFQKLRRHVLTAKLGRIRSNLILRIPQALTEALGLSEKSVVRLRLKDPHDFEVQLA